MREARDEIVGERDAFERRAEHELAGVQLLDGATDLVQWLQGRFDTVNVLVDLKDGYGFVNTGGPHTPFAFNLAGSESGVTAEFIQPSGGNYTFGIFSLNLGGGLSDTASTAINSVWMPKDIKALLVGEDLATADALGNKANPDKMRANIDGVRGVMVGLRILKFQFEIPPGPENWAARDPDTKPCRGLLPKRTSGRGATRGLEATEAGACRRVPPAPSLSPPSWARF